MVEREIEDYHEMVSVYLSVWETHTQEEREEGTAKLSQWTRETLNESESERERKTEMGTERDWLRKVNTITQKLFYIIEIKYWYHKDLKISFKSKERFHK